MISITGITDNYILQPGLINKHRKTLEWLSSIMLWKREVIFFQRVLEQYASQFTTVADKKRIDHFQNLITYYGGEIIDTLRKKLRDHESNLADAFQTKNELGTAYFKDHGAIMQELETFSISFKEFKEEFFGLIEKAMCISKDQLEDD